MGRIRDVEYGHAEYVLYSVSTNKQQMLYVNNRHAYKQLVNW